MRFLARLHTRDYLVWETTSASVAAALLLRKLEVICQRKFQPLALLFKSWNVACQHPQVSDFTCLLNLINFHNVKQMQNCERQGPIWYILHRFNAQPHHAANKWPKTDCAQCVVLLSSLCLHVGQLLGFSPPLQHVNSRKWAQNWWLQVLIMVQKWDTHTIHFYAWRELSEPCFGPLIFSSKHNGLFWWNYGLFEKEHHKAATRSFWHRFEVKSLLKSMFVVQCESCEHICV